MSDLSKKISQVKFADLVGITQPAVSGLVARGILTVGESGADWLLSYCGHLRDVAAGRSHEAQSLDSDEQLARLRAAQAEKIEMSNEQVRGELVSAVVLAEVLAKAGAKIVALLEAIPGSVKRRVPDLSATDIGFIQSEIVKARNEISSLSLGDIEDDTFEE